MGLDINSFLTEAGRVRPSKRQLEWFNTEFYAFIHFSPNTYTNREWGLGNEDPNVFNPIGLDCDSWVEAVKSAGMKGIILTAKHHDGFCLWQTETTLHSVKSSSWRGGKGDVVRELSDACHRGGLKFGFYLSPWDRNSKFYGTPEYNDFFRRQLTELLTGYGELFEVWFDGACGEGPSGRRQSYEFESYFELIRKYQPNACIFNDHGPDVRWCGNEAGRARSEEWSVVPSELCGYAERQTDGPALEGDLSYMYNTLEDTGSLNTILYSKGLVFAGSEIDMSIRPGWFYHSNEEPHPLRRLFDTYVSAVGGNACLNLNIPPMPSGRFDERDCDRLAELGHAIKGAFGNPLPADAYTISVSDGGFQKTIDIEFVRPTAVNYLLLAENIAEGQRVARFMVRIPSAGDGWDTRFEGTTIGHKRICRLALEPVTKLRILIASSRGEPLISDIALF